MHQLKSNNGREITITRQESK